MNIERDANRKEDVWVEELVEDVEGVKGGQGREERCLLGVVVDGWDEEEGRDHAHAGHGHLKPVDNAPIGEGDDDASDAGSCVYHYHVCTQVSCPVYIPIAGPMTDPTM